MAVARREASSVALQEQATRRAEARAPNTPGVQKVTCPSLNRADPPPASSPAADTFCLLCLAVEEVDHVQLRPNTRHAYTRVAAAGVSAGTAAEGAAPWVVRSVNP